MRSLIYLLCIFTDVTFIYAQSQLSTLAESMYIRVKMVDNLQYNEQSHTVRIYIRNIGNESIPSSGWRLYFHSMYILYPGELPKNMSVYLEVEKVRVGMIQGDLYYLEPSTGFVEIQPGEERDYDIKVAWWSVARTDFMPNWYIASDKPNVEPVVVKSTSSLDLQFVEPFNDARQWKRYAADRYNPYTPQERFSRLSVQDKGKIGQLILPTPKDHKEGLTTIDVDSSWKIYLGDDYFKSSEEYLAELLRLETASVQGPKSIALLRDSGLPHEGYRLRIYPSNSSILMESNDKAGMFYAVQSLRSITDRYQKLKIPQLVIEDAPRYHYRGMHIDVARNFHSADDVKRLMNVMAMYKMNKLHLHLSDDEGWRLEITDIPELAQVGGKRCHDLSERSCIIPQFGSGPFNSTSGSGFFSTEEYKDLLSFASINHIQVIPEFDMPGHAHAAIAAMEERYRRYNESGNETEASKYRLKDPDDTSEYISVQQWLDNALNPCLNSTYALIGKVMDTLIELHKDIQPLEIYNFGGDEVAGGAWERSPICQTFIHNNPKYNATKGLKMYFVERVAALAADKNLSLAGWEDGFADGHHDPIDRKSLPVSNVYAIAWNNIWEWGGASQAYKLANAGYKVILAPATNLYFDQPQEPDPEERGLYWATRFTDTRKVLKFMPDTLYDNIFEERSGKTITKQDICSADMSKCTKLENLENVIGIQGQLWSETVRTSQNVDYMIYPRLLALAERAWHKAEFETVSDEDKDERFKIEWENFANTLGYKELHRLDKMNVQYRVPPPGARINSDGGVEVSPTYPGLQTQVSYDDGNLWTNVSTAPLMFRNGQSYIHLRSLSADRKRFSRPVLLEKDVSYIYAQSQLSTLAESMFIRVKMVDNLQYNEQSHTVRIYIKNSGNESIPSSGWRLYFHSMYILYPGELPKNMSVYLEVEKVRVGMIQGDLYYLEPSTGFVEIQPGEERDYDIKVAWWSVARTDFMPNWYIASDKPDVEPVVVKSTSSLDLQFVEPFNDVRQWKRYAADRYNPYTPQERFSRLSVQDKGKIGQLILPTPKDHKEGLTTIDVDSSWKIYLGDDFFKSSEEYLAELLRLETASVHGPKSIALLRDSGLPHEGYRLRIYPSNSSILMESNDKAGMFYAVQSLRSITDRYQKLKIPQLVIEDAPRYHYRGMHIDVARNFHSADDVKRLMNIMAMYKMNKLHLHLSDDEGWRLEIPDIPELAQVGGKRCHDLSERSCIIPQFGSGPFNSTSGSGFFSTEEYKDLLSFASINHIQVIPEFDMPGHAHAAIAAMEERYRRYNESGNETEASKYRLKDPDDSSEYISVQQWLDNALNPCLNSTYALIGKVMDTLIELHKDIQPLEIYNFGGDEVAGGAWERSPICLTFIHNNPKYNATKGLKMYFVERVAALAADKNLSLAGWEDGFADGHHDPIDRKSLPVSNVYAIAWNNIWEWGGASQAYKLANAGYKVILAPATNLYFDQPQEPDPEERGLYWATRFTDTRKVLKFMPDTLYDNIFEERSGKTITKQDICSADMSKCTKLENLENVIGIQGQLWSETVRTSQNVDYMIYPRLLALAERAWHKAEFETVSDEDKDERFKTEWENFANTLGYKELLRLDKMNVQYRVPPPGARVNSDGGVEVSPTYPGLQTQVSYDDGNLWTNVSTTPLMFRNGQSYIHLRSLSADKKRFSRPVLLEKEEMLDCTDQHIIDYIADNLVVRLNVIDNLNNVYTQDGQRFIRMRLELQNNGSNNIVSGTWRIYLYSLYGARTEKLDCGLKVEHENGALYYFTPSNRTFMGINPGDTLVCNYLNMHWMVSRTDNMPNWYVTSLGMQPKAIQHTLGESLDYVGKFNTPEKWKRVKTDQYDPFTPAVRYDMYKTSLDTVRQPYKIVPTPLNMKLDDSASFMFTSNDWVVLSSSEFGFEANYLAEKLTSRLVPTKPDRNYVEFKKVSLEETSSEAYVLNIESTHITITANKAAGAFYGVQSLVSLLEGNNGQLGKITIKDKPRYPYRGVMLDTARNFKPKEWILQFLDMMAIYKLNKLHFHLSDDEAWRIAIPTVPELSQIASQRCHSDYDGVCIQPALGSGPNKDNTGSGFYSVEDYKDILKYANKYHIEIIPEIDVPGHSYAAIAATNFREKQIQKLKRHGSKVPESFLLSNFSGEKIFSVQQWWNNALDPCLNSTYRFIEVVIDALIEIHKDVQQLNVFHIGGDEVASGAWNDSAACIAMFGSGKQTDTKQLQRYFTRRVADILASRGLNLASWDDGLYADNKPDNISYYKSREVYAYTWDNRDVNIKRPAEFANEGYKVVLPLATHLYFDQAQGPDPEERGLYWATRYTDTEKTFGLLPDNLYANVDVDRMGNPVSLNKICSNKPCPTVNKTENILGLEACMWAETMRTRDQFHYMAFPRLLALAERAWHKAPWEGLNDKDQRNSKRKENWKEFSDNLAFNEFRRLEKYNVSYRIPPPGARIEGGVLKANTKYANLEVQWRQNDNQKWDIFVETKLSPGSRTYWLRAKSKTSDITSRAVEITTNVVSASARCVASTGLIYAILLCYFYAIANKNA